MDVGSTVEKTRKPSKRKEPEEIVLAAQSDDKKKNRKKDTTGSIGIKKDSAVAGAV